MPVLRVGGSWAASHRGQRHIVGSVTSWAASPRGRGSTRGARLTPGYKRGHPAAPGCIAAPPNVVDAARRSRCSTATNFCPPSVTNPATRRSRVTPFVARGEARSARRTPAARRRCPRPAPAPRRDASPRRHAERAPTQNGHRERNAPPPFQAVPSARATGRCGRAVLCPDARGRLDPARGDARNHRPPCVPGCSLRCCSRPSRRPRRMRPWSACARGPPRRASPTAG